MKLKDITQLIRSERQSQELTAETLANQSKTTKSIILNFENGKAGITLSTFGRICDALGLEIELKTKL